MAGRLQQQTFGPFTKGVIDRANPDLNLMGAVRSAKGLQYSGANKLTIRPGTRTVLTLKDDAGSPASVTSVCAVVPFGDGALAVAHSTNTNKAYLYRLKASMDDWYDAAGTLQGTTSPQPVAVLWASIASAPDVTIAEGLGIAYIAHAEALDGSTLSFPTRQYSYSNPSSIACSSLTSAAGTATFTSSAPHGLMTGDTVTVTGAVQTEYNVTRKAVTVTSSTTFTYAITGAPASPATGTPVASATIVKLMSDLNADATVEDLYFTGVASFQQHLWGWGFGSGTTASTGYRAELARFSGAIFSIGTQGLFSSGDSLTLGHRVRSQREAIIAGYAAGNALFLGGPYLLTRVTGFGRDSWYREPLDSSYGFVGPKCGVAVGGTLYYWSPAGPCRVRESGEVEPLFVPIAAFVDTVINTQYITAGYDQDTQTVMFAVDTGTGVRTRVPFDVARNCWLGPDDDFGMALRGIGSVVPIYTATAAATAGPTAAPSSASTTAVGVTIATANWTNGDITSPTQVEIRQQGGSTWTVSTTVGAGISTYTFSGLIAGTAYEWRCAHVKDGIASSYLGPSASTQFTTSSGALSPPTNPAISSADDYGNPQLSYPDHANLIITWTNSGETGVETEVWTSTDGVTYTLQFTEPNGAASASMTVYDTGTTTYYAKMKHVRSTYTDSAFTTPVSTTVTIV